MSSPKADEVWILGDLVLGQLTVNLVRTRLAAQGQQDPRSRQPRHLLEGPQEGPQPGHRIF